VQCYPVLKIIRFSSYSGHLNKSYQSISASLFTVTMGVTSWIIIHIKYIISIYSYIGRTSQKFSHLLHTPIRVWNRNCAKDWTLDNFSPPHQP